MSRRAAIAVLVVLAALAVLLLASRKDEAAPAGALLPPLTAANQIVALPGGAHVSVPLGATVPRPIVIVLHSDSESAAQQCKIWRGITGGRPFVLCPELGGQQSSVEAALRAALTELKAAFDDHVAGGSVILAGFGSGAEHAVQIARQEPAFFARLVLVDGGHSWSATAAGAFKQRGGQRLLFVCSSEPCRAALEPKLPVIRSQNLAVELLHDRDVKGALDGRLVALLTEWFSWLTSNERPQRVPNPRGRVAE